MGIMQTEIQEKREWISKPEFVEGLALVNMLPGPGATQLGIFIGHAKAGLAGGVIAGLCFVLPAFLIMLALASAYVAFGTLPSVRNAFYGIGPVVVGIFATSVYRLGKGTIRERSQIAIGVAAAITMFLTPVGLVLPLMAAGCVGIALFNSRRLGLIALAVLVAVFGAYYLIDITLTPFITCQPRFFRCDRMRRRPVHGSLGCSSSRWEHLRLAAVFLCSPSCRNRWSINSAG